MKHMYSVIRYVPDPIRGEFVNVGAIAGSDESSEWEVRQVANLTRARRIDERGSLSAVWAFIDQLARAVDVHEEAIDKPKLGDEAFLSEAWLQELFETRRNIVQLSPPAPILADTASEALDEVFTQLIVDPAPHRGGENTKHPALAAVRKAYRDIGLAKHRDVHERVVIHAGEHRERLDFAVANGRVVQLAQTWSFRVADQDALAESVRAWGWTINAVKNGGGVIQVGGRELAVPRDVNVAVVLIPPRDGEVTEAIDDARAVFHELKANPIDVAHAGQVAATAKDLLDSSVCA